MKLMKNRSGEYNYQFHWMDEDGRYVGFNDVWAPNVKEARKRAKEMNSPAHWSLYDAAQGTYITVPEEVQGQGHCYYNKGMYANPKSFKKATYEMSRAMDRIGNMLSC